MWDFYPVRQSRHIRLVKTLVKDWLIFGFLSAINQASIQSTWLSVSQCGATNHPYFCGINTNLDHIWNSYVFFFRFCLDRNSYGLAWDCLIILGKSYLINQSPVSRSCYLDSYLDLQLALILVTSGQVVIHILRRWLCWCSREFKR